MHFIETIVQNNAFILSLATVININKTAKDYSPGQSTNIDDSLMCISVFP